MVVEDDAVDAVAGVVAAAVAAAVVASAQRIAAVDRAVG
jgi:hypothetical protein